VNNNYGFKCLQTGNVKDTDTRVFVCIRNAMHANAFTGKYEMLQTHMCRANGRVTSDFIDTGVVERVK